MPSSRLVDERWGSLSFFSVPKTDKILTSGPIVPVCWGLAPSEEDGLQEHQKPLGQNLPGTPPQPQAIIILGAGTLLTNYVK